MENKHFSEEKKFLKGPQSRISDLLFTLRVAKQFIKGFRVLHFVGPCITVFGSARFTEDNIYYQMAREIGKRIASIGFTTITGGGPGIMEAANRGARESGGKSVGVNIELPNEQKPNPYLDKFVEIHYFFARKVLLFKYSKAFIVMPGGFGTMDEMFEALTLIQTKKSDDFPVVLFGKEYWADLLEQLHIMAQTGTINASDMDLFIITDSIDEAMNHLIKYMDHQFSEEEAPKPRAILMESGIEKVHTS
jgi:uncharacterized protein (TIGR00730 family)